MSGTLDLSELLEGMQPELEEGISYIFLTIPDDVLRRNAPSVSDVVVSHAIASFRESEGLTIVLKSTFLQGSDSKSLSEELKVFWKTFAEKEELPRMSHITMRIHSSLSAVGFTSAFTRALTEAGVSCNVFAGYYHDHIFVPSALQSTAMAVLTALSKESSASN